MKRQGFKFLTFIICTCLFELNVNMNNEIFKKSYNSNCETFYFTGNGVQYALKINPLPFTYTTPCWWRNLCWKLMGSWENQTYYLQTHVYLLFSRLCSKIVSGIFSEVAKKIFYTSYDINGKLYASVVEYM